MNNWLLEVLRCPVCRERLEISRALQTDQGSLVYGMVSCTGCTADFPVVEGIPLMLPPDARGNIYAETAEDIVMQGAPVSAISAAITEGDKVAAFALLLDPLSLAGPGWQLVLPEPAQRRTWRQASGTPVSTTQNQSPSLKQRLTAPLRKVYRRTRARYRQFMLPRWRKALAEYLIRYQSELSASEVIELYYGHYSGNAEIGHYFMYRFGQPRHLAALSLARLLRNSDGCLLDVACGAGHLTHYLSYGRQSGTVTGVDRDFFRLYLAKRFIAPQAQFACVSTDPVLPLASNLFEGVLCSDAFHIMREKKSMLQEFKRCLTDNGSICLARVSNAEMDPHEGYELNVGGYADLLADWPCAITDEDDLRDRYLKRTGPDLSHHQAGEFMRQKKWLNFFATCRQELLIEHGQFDDWPHAIGKQDINPIYGETVSEDDSERRFSFCFPSAWYEYENADYQRYASESFRMKKVHIEQLTQTGTATSTEQLERFEIVGMPDRYFS